MSKSAIIEAIRRNKPAALTPLPAIPNFLEHRVDAVETFIAVAEAGGCRVVRTSDPSTVNAALKKHFPKAGIIASPLSLVDTTLNLTEVQSPIELEQVDVAVIKGQLGVAENGAIWITEADCTHRVLPFICQHLVIILDQADIVQNMHVAYEKIQVNEQGFGLFIAGPSKTADIEQALVIGAQAARSLTIFLITQSSG